MSTEAHRLGRGVGAVPGPVTSVNSIGPHELVRTGMGNWHVRDRRGTAGDLGDLYNGCQSAQRRMLNRVLYTRIIIDDDENVTYVPAEPTASVLAQVNAGLPTHLDTETNLPRHQAGQVRFSGLTWS